MFPARAAIAAVAFLALVPAARADFDAGKAAFERHDYARAYRELLPEAQNGNAEAEYMIGEMAAGGLGTPRSYQLAAQWYGMAAAAGQRHAYITLGLLYLHGAGAEEDLSAIPADPARAAGYLEVAAAQGDKEAQYLMGQLYMTGTGVPKDVDKAHDYTIKAARRGVPGAAFNAGVLALRGGDTPENLIEAYKWFSIAARAQYPGAAQNRTHVATDLTPEQKAKAEALVTAFRPLP